MAEPATERWALAIVTVGSDPWLLPPSAADRALVVTCGGVVDEHLAGAA